MCIKKTKIKQSVISYIIIKDTFNLERISFTMNTKQVKSKPQNQNQYEEEIGESKLNFVFQNTRKLSTLTALGFCPNLAVEGIRFERNDEEFE